MSTPKHMASVRLIVTSALFAILVAAVLLTFPRASAEAGGPRACNPGNLSGSLPKPPRGKVTHQRVTVDENCDVIWGPIEFVSAYQIPKPHVKNMGGARLKSLQASLSRTLPGLGSTSTMGITAAGSSSLHPHSQVWDCCGILMNELYSDVYWSYNGSVVTSYSVGGGYNWHTENSPPSCGGGWSPVNPYSIKTGGGVGQASVSFKQHVEFGYKGVFDCSGNTYYNTLENVEVVRGGGGYDCNLSYYPRNTAFGWHWDRWCN